jgi:hypothetical protein
MKTIGIILGALLALWGLRWAYVQLLGTDEFEYRGHTIKMTRKYIDYDAYKNDTDNILESELPKLERLITEAKLSSSFRDWKAFVGEEFALKVPGYGIGGGPKVVSPALEFLVSSVEIPTRPPAEKFRYFVLEKLQDGTLRLVDDFVGGGFPRIAEVHVLDSKLVYFSRDKAVVRETRL